MTWEWNPNIISEFSLSVPDERSELLRYAVSVIGTGSKCIELGVQWGEHAKLIFDELRPSSLYLLDSWQSGVEHGTTENDEYYEELFNRTKETFSNYNNVKLIRDRTDVAHLKFYDKYFDFIYVDADHEYSAIKKDLNNWMPKLKRGGIIAGHDFDDRRPGVIRAVNEFVENNSTLIKTFKMFGDVKNNQIPCWLVKTR